MRTRTLVVAAVAAVLATAGVLTATLTTANAAPAPGSTCSPRGAITTGSRGSTVICAPLPSDPSNKWRTIVVKGATGPQGPAGPAGPAGPQGPTGPACPNGYTATDVKVSTLVADTTAVQAARKALQDAEDAIAAAQAAADKATAADQAALAGVADALVALLQAATDQEKAAAIVAYQDARDAQAVTAKAAADATAALAAEKASHDLDALRAAVDKAESDLVKPDATTVKACVKA